MTRQRYMSGRGEEEGTEGTSEKKSSGRESGTLNSGPKKRTKSGCQNDPRAKDAQFYQGGT